VKHDRCAQVCRPAYTQPGVSQSRHGHFRFHFFHDGAKPFAQRPRWCRSEEALHQRAIAPRRLHRQHRFPRQPRCAQAARPCCARTTGVAAHARLVQQARSVLSLAAPRRPDVRAVFDLTLQLAQKYSDRAWSDQTYFSLAIEILGFNPHCLSPSFNYRGFGELISGSIRIWHSYDPLPKNAASLEKGYLHRYEKGKLVKAVKVPL